MKEYAKEDIFRIVQDEDVEFIRMQFTDIFGNFKNNAVTSSQLQKALDGRCRFDGSMIEGFADVEASDLYLRPDCSTLEIFPWRPQQGKVARMICDIYDAEGRPFAGDSRYVLRRAVKAAADMGYTFHVGPECEFFLFHTDENALPTTVTHEQAGYFDVGPLDFGENARRDMVLTLEKMGFEIEASHHEAAPAQHEIDFRYDEALHTADNIMTFKLAVKTMAKHHGLHATFMPKPKYGASGSGMHINMSLTRDGKNIFEEPSDPAGMSREAYWFIGGLMKHVKGMAAVTNPLVNSYKRLVSGCDAPAYIAWSRKNKSAMILVSGGGGEEMHIELRNPDPSANPYLTLAVCLSAGMDGIKNRIMPPRGVDDNLYTMSGRERSELGIETLPATLAEAVAELGRDSLVREVLGAHLAEKYMAAKMREWNQYAAQVTDWEIHEYLYRF